MGNKLSRNGISSNGLSKSLPPWDTSVASLFHPIRAFAMRPVKFACRFCMKRFREKDQARIHMKSCQSRLSRYTTAEYDTEERKTPIRVSDIIPKQQQDRADGPKSKTCGYCGKKFNRVDNRIVHERCHTGEKPYACKNCPYRSSYVASMRAHEKRCYNQRNMTSQAHKQPHAPVDSEKPDTSQILNHGSRYGSQSAVRKFGRPQGSVTRPHQRLQITARQLNRINMASRKLQKRRMSSGHLQQPRRTSNTASPEQHQDDLSDGFQESATEPSQPPKVTLQLQTESQKQLNVQPKPVLGPVPRKSIHEIVQASSDDPERRNSLICIFCSKVFKGAQSRLWHEFAHQGIKPFGCRFCHYKCSYPGNVALHEALCIKKRPEDRGPRNFDWQKVERINAAETEDVKSQLFTKINNSARASVKSNSVKKTEKQGEGRYKCRYCPRYFPTPKGQIIHETYHTVRK